MLFKKIVYTDCLKDWRKNKVWEYNFLDKVIVTETRRNSKSGYVWEVIIVTNYDDSNWHSYYYSWITKDWYNLTEIKVKPYYWELQSEFELLDKVEKEAKELEAIEKDYKEKAESLAKLSKKLDRDKLENIINLHLIK
jgi:hypothetical protein